MPSEELSGGSNFPPLSLSEVWKVVISRFNSVGRGANEQARNFRKDLPPYLSVYQTAWKHGTLHFMRK